MSSEDNTSGGKPGEFGHVQQRLQENARLIDRAERALQAIARTIDETSSMMPNGATGRSSPWKLAKESETEFESRVDALLQRMVVDLIGTFGLEPGSSPHPMPDEQGGKPTRRPGQYRELI
ncbi:hypothetical protein [Noviherbaspirillum pedocola]|uniref:Uncharacterized protein n=1 Tax=Noviherbaspirillum pedocola TaxID=2801341 RepID=A0A934SWR2_9BURK|nr:hypothetical protein [Noviherbaspirillum pedocola]MBK4733253.1 hypothetical protein [Noviherbaspirillum pedocola]